MATAWLLACAIAALAESRPAHAAGQPTLPATAPRSALLVFLAPGGRSAEPALARARGMSVGIMSASQGPFTAAQMLLDITQGTRVASSAYKQGHPPALALRVSGAGAGGTIEGWAAVRRRAGDAPQLLYPGLLASSIPQGAGYVGTSASRASGAIAAADRRGAVAAVSPGSASTLLARVAELRKRRSLVVSDLAPGALGLAQLRALAATRPAHELLIAVALVPDSSSGKLLWVGAAGLAGGEGRTLSSETTNQRGLLTSMDLAPTILAHVELATPSVMHGAPLRTGPRLSAADLPSLMARLRVVGGRRLKTLAFVLCAWAVLLLGAALAPGRAGARRAWALRTGALGVLWAPALSLIPAAVEPGAAAEYATIALACMALGALSDRLLGWPAAPLLPACATLVAFVWDALAGTQLLVRSVFGPNPLLGARFYGIGNELKSWLAVLVLAGGASVLHLAARRTAGAAASGATPWRRAVAVMVGAGALLAVVEGSARIGAGVGGVILVSAGTAVAAALLLPGPITRRRALIVLISPAAALVALAALDLLTAHGSGHFSGSILHARSTGDLRDVLVRRYTDAWHELRNHAMPAATALALVCAAAGVRARARVLAPVAAEPAWQAALAGGLAAGIVGALTEDSGPVLLVVAMLALACVTTYLWGRPPARASTREP